MKLRIFSPFLSGLLSILLLLAAFGRQPSGYRNARTYRVTFSPGGN